MKSLKYANERKQCMFNLLVKSGGKKAFVKCQAHCFLGVFGVFCFLLCVNDIQILKKESIKQILLTFVQECCLSCWAIKKTKRHNQFCFSFLSLSLVGGLPNSTLGDRLQILWGNIAKLF